MDDDRGFGKLCGFLGKMMIDDEATVLEIECENDLTDIQTHETLKVKKEGGKVEWDYVKYYSSAFNEMRAIRKKRRKKTKEKPRPKLSELKRVWTASRIKYRFKIK